VPELGSQVLTIAETAAEVRQSESRFRRNWPNLVREHGFPAPLPGFQRCLWSRVRVHGWIETVGAGPSDRTPQDSVAARRRNRLRQHLGLSTDGDPQ
jgi:hypothetical protein